MSAEARKNCRTQGKYSDRNEDKKTRKSLEKRLKESPTEKETQEKKFLKRKSDGTKEATSFSSENTEPVLEYQQNSDYSFTQLEDRKKPVEIKKPGKFVLSNTENGESSVLYEPNFYTKDEAWELFDCLFDTTEWLDKSIVIHGVEYPQPRLVAWYGPLPYSYSGTTLEPAEMPDCVLSIKRRVEDYLKGQNINVELNSVLLNLYRNNKDSVSWHSDDELTMGICPTIASISLGETRKFEMRPKSNRYYEDDEKKGDEYFAHLNNGSLIIMDGCMQEDWQHRVPKEYHDRNPRINLTFRTVYEFEKGSPYSDSRVNNSKPVEQEIPKNSSRVKIDLDEENFPPLSSISNNVNSKTAHKSSEKTEPFSKINDQINSSEEEWTVKTPPSNKVISRINDKINASEDEWVVKTPVGAKVLCPSTKTNVTAEESRSSTVESTSNKRDHPENTKEEEWEVPSPVRVNCYSEFSEISKSNYNCYEESASISHPTPSESNDKSHKDWYYESCKSEILSESNKSNQLPEEKLERSFDCQQQTSMESDKTFRSNDNYLRKTPLESNKPYRSNEDNFDGAHPRQTPLESNKSHQSNEDNFERAHRRRTPFESNKPYQSNENNFERAHQRRTPLESNKPYRSNEYNFERAHQRRNFIESNKSHLSNEDYFERAHQRRTPLESNKLHEERTTKAINKTNGLLETNRYDRHNERGYTEPCNKNISRRERNFNSDELESFESHNTAKSAVSNNEKKSVEQEFSNENVDGYEQRSIENQNSNSKERRNESSNIVVYSTRSHFSNMRNEPFMSRSKGWKPNVKAKEFSDMRNEPFSKSKEGRPTVKAKEFLDMRNEPFSKSKGWRSNIKAEEFSDTKEELLSRSKGWTPNVKAEEFSDTKEELLSRSKGWRPNVKAEEFVPGKTQKPPSEVEMHPSSVDCSTFGHFSLTDLLNYNVDLMPSDDLKNYANALKFRVLKEISTFEISDKEQLEVLCEITDGTQTDKNQKIICSRICALVKKTVPNQQLNYKINPAMPRYQQQANYRNENHYLERRWPM